MLNKSEIIAGHRLHGSDTGSCEVQVALASRRISNLTEHMRENRKDFSSRRGLIALTNLRRRLLAYLKRKDPARYSSLIASLGLRK